MLADTLALIRGPSVECWESSGTLLPAWEARGSLFLLSRSSIQRMSWLFPHSWEWVTRYIWNSRTRRSSWRILITMVTLRLVNFNVMVLKASPVSEFKLKIYLLQRTRAPCDLLCKAGGSLFRATWGLRWSRNVCHNSPVISQHQSWLLERDWAMLRPSCKQNTNYTI